MIQNKWVYILGSNTYTYAYSIYNESTLPAYAPVIFDLTNPAKIFALANHTGDSYTARGGEWINGLWYAFDRSSTLGNRLVTIDPSTGSKQ
jgi:hypothetical protein